MPDPSTPPLPPRLLLFDGACGLCLGAAAWLRRRDRDRRLRLARLQGPMAARARGLLPEVPPGVDTAVFIEAGRVHLRSQALLGAARHLPPPWRWLAALRWLPPWLLDPGYRLVARHRGRPRCRTRGRATEAG
jgi:predicted DCC family thiol-disulfide oxidoreductase YuxK